MQYLIRFMDDNGSYIRTYDADLSTDNIRSSLEAFIRVTQLTEPWSFCLAYGPNGNYGTTPDGDFRQMIDGKYQPV